MSAPTPSNNVQISPYLIDQRKFPERDVGSLAGQMDRAYIDIAKSVNYRTIGITATEFPAQTGEKWYLQGGVNYQQTLRQLYSFTGAGNIAHGIDFNSVAFVSPRSYGTYTDGTNWYGVIYASSTGIASEVTFYVTATNIVVSVGGGAPAVTSGYILLEWVSQV